MSWDSSAITLEDACEASWLIYLSSPSGAMCQDGSGQCLDDQMWLLLEVSGIFLSPMTLFFVEVAPELVFCSLETSWSSWLADQVTYQNFRVLSGVPPIILWILTDIRGQGPNGCFFLDPFTSLILVSKFFLNIQQGSFTSLKQGITGYNFNISNSTVIYHFSLVGVCISSWSMT